MPTEDINASTVSEFRAGGVSIITKSYFSSDRDSSMNPFLGSVLMWASRATRSSPPGITS